MATIETLISEPRTADETQVSGNGSDDRNRLDEILLELPAEVAVGYQGTRRLVVSGGGVFVLDRAHGGLDPFFELTKLAAATRDHLAQHLTWVPFVDWFAVTDKGDVRGPTIPHDLVEQTVLEGHGVDPTTLQRIGSLLTEGSFVPLWYPGLPSPGGDVRTTVGELPLA